MKRAFATLLLLAACHRHASTKHVVAEQPLSRAAYAHYMAGKMAVYGHDWPHAIEELTAARAAAPCEAMIVVELARAQVKAKQAAAAAATLADAEKQWPDHPEVWIAAGDLQAEAKATPAAVTSYKRAIALAPDDERGYLGLAKADPAHAEDTLHALVKRVPGSVEGHYRLAVGYDKREDLANAIAELRAVLEHDPDHIDARLDLARALRRTGHLDEAVIQTRSAFDRAAQPLDVAEELFWVLAEAEDLQGAIDLLTLLDDDRSDLDGLALIARLDRTLGRIAAAREVAEQMARADAEVGAIALAEADAAGGDRAGAIARLTALFDGARGTEARRIAAELMLANGAPQDALTAIAPLRAKPEGAKELGLALLAGFALVDLKRIPDAKATVTAAAAAAGDPNAAEARFVMARVLERAGDRAGAIALLGKLFAEHPEATTADNLYGYLLVETGQLAAAKAPLQRARDQAPGDPAILDSWGVWQLKSGAVKDAIKTLTRAVKTSPLEAEITVHLAEAWVADHGSKTAVELLDRAATLAPSPTVTRRIAEIRQAIAGQR